MGEVSTALRALSRSIKQLFWFAVALALVSLLRSIHATAPAPSLETAVARDALGWARRVVAGALGDGPAAGAGPTPISLERRVREPVHVSLYGPDARGRQDPALGSWIPTDDEPEIALGGAITRAARAAAEVARGRGVTTAAGLRVKLDLAGSSAALWSRAGPYLNWVLVRGVDGISAERGGARAVLLPARGAELRGGLADACVSLETALGGRGTRWTRFRTTAYVEAGPGGGEPARVVRGNVPVVGVDAAAVRRALLLAGHYLARAVGRNGRYCYSYRAREDRCTDEYSLLRHAGTTYSLYQIYGLVRDPTLLNAAERASAWLREQIRPVPGDPSRAFLIEGDRAKLGAVGLTLIALIERERAVGDGKDRGLLRRLAAFAVSQQRSDGYFASYFAYSPEVPVPRQNSIYYPGEALLGLVRLHRLEPDARLLTAATLGARFLAERRWSWGGVELYVPPDAWLTQALAELDAVTPADWLRDYAYRIVRVMEGTMLREEEGTPPDLAGGPAMGPFAPDVTPAGARNEALTSAWQMARRRGEVDTERWLARAALRAAGFQLSWQLRPETTYFLPDPARAAGGFRSPLDDEIRIDYVQHNATGLLGVLAILDAEAG